MSHHLESQDLDLNDRPLSNSNRELLLARESIQELSVENLDNANGGWATPISQGYMTPTA